jgi:hypothetical protein
LWPEFPTLHGWLHEDEVSIKLKANVLVPSGKSFFDSPAVIYGGAVYHPRSPETASLEQLVANDISEALDEVSAMGSRRMWPGHQSSTRSRLGTAITRLAMFSRYV